MKIFYPRFSFRRVTDLTVEWLKGQGISALLLDVDNTLTTHNNPEVPAEVLDWLHEMRAAGMKLLLLSNNHPARVAPFAQKLGVGFIADAAKPLGGGVKRSQKVLGETPEGIALVGDQIFTDVLAGRLAGAVSILVEPIEPETAAFFRLKRRLEAPILKRYQRRLTALGGRRPDKTEGGIK